MEQNNDGLSNAYRARFEQEIEACSGASNLSNGANGVNRGFFSGLRETIADMILTRTNPPNLNNQNREDGMSFILNIPSGKLVVSDDMGDIFPLDSELTKKELVHRDILKCERTKWYADNNCAWAYLGYGYPYMIANENGVISFEMLAGNEEDFDTEQEFHGFLNSQLADGEKLLSGSIPARYELILSDYEEWVSRGGNPDDLDVETFKDFEDSVSTVFEVPAGEYRVTSYSTHHSFWEQKDDLVFENRTCFIKMEPVKKQ